MKKAFAPYLKKKLKKNYCPFVCGFCSKAQKPKANGLF